jgi:hypothetical protein
MVPKSIVRKVVTEPMERGAMKQSEKTSGSSSAGDAIAAESGHVSRRDGPARDERIRMRAYELYCERGGAVGDDTIDWLWAEREYLERAPRPT